MKWTEIDIEMPICCTDILFTDGERVYKGWLETYEFGEEPVFCNDTCSRRDETWPENITHWMDLPEVPKK